jgi:hypothetical protein
LAEESAKRVTGTECTSQADSAERTAGSNSLPCPGGRSRRPSCKGARRPDRSSRKAHRRPGPRTSCRPDQSGTCCPIRHLPRLPVPPPPGRTASAPMRGSWSTPGTPTEWPRALRSASSSSSLALAASCAIPSRTGPPSVSIPEPSTNRKSRSPPAVPPRVGAALRHHGARIACKRAGDWLRLSQSALDWLWETKTAAIADGERVRLRCSFAESVWQSLESPPLPLIAFSPLERLGGRLYECGLGPAHGF